MTDSIRIVELTRWGLDLEVETINWTAASKIGDVECYATTVRRKGKNVDQRRPPTLEAAKEEHAAFGREYSGKATASQIIRALVDACERLLASVDGDEDKPQCWCTSSGNEEPPGSVDIFCGACLARAALKLAKEGP